MTRYPAALACVPLVIGILIGRSVHPPDFVMFCAAAISLVLGVVALYEKWRTVAMVAGVLCLLLLGLFRFNLLSGNYPPNHISRFNDHSHRVTVAGRVAREVDLRIDRTYLTVECDTIWLANNPIGTSGLLLIRIAEPDSRFSYSDRIEVTGYLSSPVERRNFHGFDYRRYLMLKQIGSYMSAKRHAIRVLEKGAGDWLLTGLIIPLREHILAMFDKHLHGDAKPLVAGLLIGETRFIPPRVYNWFKDTGTLHLLAVSGSNVAVVAGTLMLLMRLAGLPRRLVLGLSLVVVFIFCQLSFNQPSVVRASLMIAVVLVGKIIYHKARLLNVISVAAFLILLFDPMMLYDVGFQLSFAATFSLIYFLSGVMPAASGRPSFWRTILNYGLMILLSSLVVQLMIAPILAYYFGTIPLVTFVSNLLLVPMASIAVMLAILLSVFGAVPFLSVALAVPTDWLLSATIRLVEFFASLPIAKLTISAPEVPHIVFYYATLFALYAVYRSRRSLKFCLIVLLIWANLAVWETAVAYLRDAPAVTILDSGQRCSLCIHTPPDYDLVITHTRSQASFDHVEKVVAPYLAGEGILSLDGWETFATPSDSNDSTTEISRPPVPLSESSYFSVDSSDSVVARSISGDNSVKFYRSADGIEVADFNFSGNRLLWLSAWSLLSVADSTPAQIVALPYPAGPDSACLDHLRRLSPERVVLYNYPNRWNHVEADSLSLELERYGMSLLTVQKSGAIKFVFQDESVDVSLAVSEK